MNGCEGEDWFLVDETSVRGANKVDEICGVKNFENWERSQFHQIWYIVRWIFFLK